MMRRVVTRAYANIALCKYWGKKSDEGNLPATPSISIALRSLSTDTEVLRLNKPPHRIKINGKRPDPLSEARLIEYLELWKKKKLISGFYAVESINHFPTGSGLASSSSGYAALALALSTFAKMKISGSELTHLARIGSGSAARSITGGLSALPMGKNPASRLILLPEEIPWGMVICAVDADAKEIPSRQGMRLSKETSPYYNAWIMRGRKDYQLMLGAIRNMDYPTIGTLCEDNALAMHACMIATRPSLIYWNEATLGLIRAVRKWRQGGLEGYFTIDAGPHVTILGRQDDLRKISARAAKVKGVVSAKISLPAGGALVMESL